VIAEAQDFFDESDALHSLLDPLDERDFGRPTAFKSWSIDTILRHLHFWNRGADLSLRDGAAFTALFQTVTDHLRSASLASFEVQALGDLKGRALLGEWRRGYAEVAEHFRGADPATRVPWAGPDMSARTSVSARLMETWAHGQAIYDELGVVRRNTNRIRSIVVLGINTYAWTFKVRELAVAAPRPYVELTAPSGDYWRFGESNSAERIEGLAEEFCQVVTQTRNIADTRLTVRGSNAVAWMTHAQCFAGRPVNPPEPGTRAVRRPTHDCRAS
jgi:uncharacterized protein (TIGR03084 family)